MTKIGGEPQRKDGKKHKEYSIVSAKKTRIAAYTYNGEIQELPIEFVEKVYITKYKGEIKDRKSLKWVPFINTFEVAAVQITGWLSIILGLVISFGTITVSSGYLASSSSEEVTGFLLAGTLLACLVSLAGFCIYSNGESLICNVKYVKATRCKKCHKNYAYEEREEPDIKEISTENSYMFTITRYWKCKYCGYIDSSESPEKIKSHKGKKEKPKEIKCEKCGKTGVSSECRDPDVKMESFPLSEVVTTTIRYYKCKYCENLNTTEVEMGTGSGTF